MSIDMRAPGTPAPSLEKLFDCLFHFVVFLLRLFRIQVGCLARWHFPERFHELVCAELCNTNQVHFMITCSTILHPPVTLNIFDRFNTLFATYYLSPDFILCVPALIYTNLTDAFASYAQPKLRNIFTVSVNIIWHVYRHG